MSAPVWDAAFELATMSRCARSSGATSEQLWSPMSVSGSVSKPNGLRANVQVLRSRPSQ